MAGSVNKVILIGNVGADPEIRRTQDGRPIANLRIATSETWRDRNSGERREKTEWHTVVVFNEGLCKVVEQYVKKGAKLYIEGALQTRKWQDQNGNDRYSTEVVLQGFNSTLTMLDGRGEGGGDRRGGSDFGGAGNFGGGGAPSHDDYGSQPSSSPPAAAARGRSRATWTTTSRSDDRQRFEASASVQRACDGPDGARVSSLCSRLFGLEGSERSDLDGERLASLRRTSASTPCTARWSPKSAGPILLANRLSSNSRAVTAAKSLPYKRWRYPTEPTVRRSASRPKVFIGAVYRR